MSKRMSLSIASCVARIGWQAQAKLAEKKKQ